MSFQPPYGLKNFWVLISILLDEDQVQLPSDYTKGIMHTRHAVKYKVVSLLPCFRLLIKYFELFLLLTEI